jgi:tripartite-type tricarboxylate transporter receptor subunit TctC
MHRKTATQLLFALLVWISIITIPIADSLSDFYQGKTVTLYIGAEPGGGFDLYARALSRYMARYIPGNPTILPMNMPGASSMILGNYLAKIAPRDGSVMGVVSPLLLFEPLFNGSQSMAQFRGPEMTMIGNGATAHWALLARHSAGIASIDDLQHKDLIVGASARAGAAYILTHAVKEVLGLNRLKIVTGYGGIREIVGALERGEISGCVMDLEDVMALQPQWLGNADIDVVAQLTPRNTAGVPVHAPSIVDFAISDEDKQVLDVILASTTLSRPLIAPPEIPPARTKSLRDGFLATLDDPDFLTEAAKIKITPSPLSGERMQDSIDAAYELPPAILARVRAVLSD